MELKICSACKTEKNINAFAANQWRLNGSKKCSKCMTEGSRAAKWWRTGHPAR